MTRNAFVRQAISAEKSRAYCFAVMLAALIAGTAVRQGLSSVAPHLTFVTYYPAILICSLLTGWRYGFACALLSGVVAEQIYLLPSATRIAAIGSVTSLVVFLSSCAIIIATADTLRRSVRELDQADSLAQTLNRELQHRVGNMLTVVHALALQSAKRASPQQFVAAFGGRLQALAKAHELLGNGSPTTCCLPGLIGEACKPFCDGQNIVTSGPACELPSASCVPLVLALHELCTNAVKYGSLSSDHGRVEVCWSFSQNPQRVVIVWQEIGGPVVIKPSHKGLGSALLRPQPGIAEVELSFDEAGVCCKLSIDGALALQPAFAATCEQKEYATQAWR